MPASASVATGVHCAKCTRLARKQVAVLRSDTHCFGCAKKQQHLGNPACLVHLSRPERQVVACLHLRAVPYLKNVNRWLVDCAHNSPPGVDCVADSAYDYGSCPCIKTCVTHTRTHSQVSAVACVREQLCLTAQLLCTEGHTHCHRQQPTPKA